MSQYLNKVLEAEDKRQKIDHSVCIQIGLAHVLPLKSQSEPQRWLMLNRFVLCRSNLCHDALLLYSRYCCHGHLGILYRQSGLDFPVGSIALPSVVESVS